jgi:hypothetical protein
MLILIINAASLGLCLRCKATSGQLIFSGMGAAHLFRVKSGLYGCSPCSYGCSQALTSFSSDGGLSFGPFYAYCVRYSFFGFFTFFIYIGLLNVYFWYLCGCPGLISQFRIWSRLHLQKLITACWVPHTVLAHANLPRPFHKSPSVQFFSLLH